MINAMTFLAPTVSAKIIDHATSRSKKPVLSPTPNLPSNLTLPQCSNLPFLLPIDPARAGPNTGLEHGLPLPRFIDMQYGAGTGLGGWKSLVRGKDFCGPGFRGVDLDNEGGKSCPRSRSKGKRGL